MPLRVVPRHAPQVSSAVSGEAEKPPVQIVRYMGWRCFEGRVALLRECYGIAIPAEHGCGGYRQEDADGDGKRPLHPGADFDAPTDVREAGRDGGVSSHQNRQEGPEAVAV